MSGKQPHPDAPPPYGAPNQPPAYTPGPYGAGIHQPPRGGVPVYPMAGYSQSSPTLVMGSPVPGGAMGPITVVNVAQWGPFPMQINCPHCAAQVMTETYASPGLLTWLLSGALVFLGCWVGCCLIPCCIPECQDIEHRCPSCKNHLGTFRRL